MLDIRTLGPDDLDLLLRVEEGLFDNPILPDQAAAFLADPHHHLMLAFDRAKAVGMVSANVLLHPDKRPAMFINELGTRESHQRRGIATTLMQAMLAHARGIGCHGVWLGTEIDNAPARALYHSMDAEEVLGAYYGWDDAF